MRLNRHSNPSNRAVVGLIVILIALIIVSYLLIQNSESMKKILGSSTTMEQVEKVKKQAGDTLGKVPQDIGQNPSKTLQYFKNQAKDIEKKISKP